MSAIGPALPPHLLAKRKRQQEKTQEDAQTTSSGAKPASSPESAEKRRRVIGPAMPPAPLEERPTKPPVARETEDSDESDDDFGPALPTNGGLVSEPADHNIDGGENKPNISSILPSPPRKLQRDDWMMIPPKQDDLAARLDPSKPRPRAFNTGKSARGGGSMDNDNSAWHETPEQKRKRLEDEMMGVAKAPEVRSGAKYGPSAEEGDRRREQIVEKSRGPSLLEQHQQTVGRDAEDDPSKRAFDREKDMASGGRISSSQRRELVNRAGNYGSKFSKGGLL